MAQKTSGKDRGQKTALKGRAVQGSDEKVQLPKEFQQNKPDLITGHQLPDCKGLLATAHRYDSTHSHQGTPAEHHNTKEPLPGSGQDGLCGWNLVLVRTALQQNAARIQQTRKCLQNSLEEACRAHRGHSRTPSLRVVSLGYTT